MHIFRVDFSGRVITVSEKFVQLIPIRILETFGLHNSIEDAFLLTYTNLRTISSFSS